MKTFLYQLMWSEMIINIFVKFHIFSCSELNSYNPIRICWRQ